MSKFLGKSAAFAVILLTISSSLSWGAEPSAPKKVTTVEGITEYQFDNGLRLLVYPDASSQKVTVNMTVLVGSRHEGYGEAGMAHLLEHMLFKGSSKFPNPTSIPESLRARGAQHNASTSRDKTNYYETLPASDENLEFALSLESDRLMTALLRAEDLASEFTVVRNEFERGENSPSRILMQRIESVAYDWHNYGKSTIGNRSDIERVPIENLRAFYKKYYQPDNVVLIIAGKFDEAKALALVQKYYGTIPRPERKLCPTYTEEPAQDGERTVILRRIGDGGAVGIAYHIPSAIHEDSVALDFLANILSAQPSGRLHKALVETKKATGAFAYAGGGHDPGLLLAQAEVRDAKTLDEVRDILIATVEEIGAKGVTDEEVNRARAQFLKSRELAAADANGTTFALSACAALGDWRLYFLERDRIEKVTAAQVQAAAARYLQRSNRTVGMFIPSERTQKVAVPPSPDIQALFADYKGRAAIAEGEAFDPSPANIEARTKRMELPGGVKVALLPKKSRGEEVQFTLTLRYGNEENLKGFETAAGFLPSLMMRGTKKLSYQQLQDELDRLQASLGTGGGGGRMRGRRGGGGGGGGLGVVSFSIQAKRETLPAVLELLRQVLREPLLPADQFEEMKNQRLAGLEQSQADPGALAGNALGRTLAPYAKDDVRYTPTIQESIERMQAVKYEQVTQLYREYLGAQAGEITIVGDFDEAKCMPIIKEMLADWKAAKPYARVASPTPEPGNGSEQKINTPDKANATYNAGMLFALRDDDPDYPALAVANYILGGGGLSSRLADRIRQKDGLSYTVNSSLGVSSLDKRASLTIFAICNPENIDRVSKGVQEEMERLLRDGVTKEELDRAKQGYLEASKVRRTSDGALVGLLSEASHLGRKMEYYAELDKKIEALTPEQILAAARKYFDPKKLVIVSAGDFESAKKNEGK